MSSLRTSHHPTQRDTAPRPPSAIRRERPHWRPSAPDVLRTDLPSSQKWDLLLLCSAGYVLTSVGRVHQLFPALGAARPAILTGVVAIVLYLADRLDERRLSHLWVPTTKCLVALLGWMMLSLPGALVRSSSFDLIFNNFIKTVLM